MIEKLIGGCSLIQLDVRGDDRGSLVALESDEGIGFPIKRVYYIFETNAGVSRGFHAHRKLQQLAVCVSGSCVITIDDGQQRQNVVLDRPDVGIRICSMIWREMHDFSPGSVLLVLASEHYDEQDYLRGYDDFIAAAAKKGSSIDPVS